MSPIERLFIKNKLENAGYDDVKDTATSRWFGPLIPYEESEEFREQYYICVNDMDNSNVTIVDTLNRNTPVISIEKLSDVLDTLE